MYWDGQFLDRLTEERALTLVNDILHDVDSFLADVEEITSHADVEENQKNLGFRELRD